MKKAVLLLLVSGVARAAEEPSCEAGPYSTSDATLLQLAAEGSTPCEDKPPPHWQNWANPTCEMQLHNTNNCALRRSGAIVDGYCHKTCGVCTVGPPAAAAAQAQAPSAVGDPHLRNVLGQRFDLMQPGNHMLMNIPKAATPQENALFRVMARADRIGGNCADLYFEALNVTGQWVEATALGREGLRVSAGSDTVSVNDGYMARWLAFGPVGLKVVRGHLPDGTAYLNLYFKNIKNTGIPVGGLLGEDDHQKEATPSAHCKSLVQLVQLQAIHGDEAAANRAGSIAQVLPE